MCELLIEAGADGNQAGGRYGRTPLRFAQMNQQVTCAAASFAIHLVVVLAALDHRVSVEPPKSLEVSAAPLVVSAILFDQSVDAANMATPRSKASIPESPDAITLPAVRLPEIQAVAADSVEVARELESLEDVKSVERLQGIYVGQIIARLERVLEMTSGTLDQKPVGSCIVHVIQNELGEVLDVDMEECPRGSDKRHLVETLIRSASPLPLPPPGLAQGTYLTLDVSSL